MFWGGKGYQQPYLIGNEIRGNPVVPPILKGASSVCTPYTGYQFGPDYSKRCLFLQSSHIQQETQFIKTRRRLGFSRVGRDLIVRREGGEMDEHRLLLRNSANRWSDSQSNKPLGKALSFLPALEIHSSMALCGQRSLSN